MNKRVLLPVFMSFFLSSSMFGMLFVVTVESLTADIIVPDDYVRIQWAIGNATVGDTIFVRAGTYYENIVVNKSVSLIGENRDTTIIDANGTGSVIDVKASNINITYFTIRNSGPEIIDAGIHVYSSNGHKISNNIITNNKYGIELLSSSYNSIYKNDITLTQIYSILIDNSSGNCIYGNSITNNLFGIGLYDSSNNTISRNNITTNDNHGMRLRHSSNNTIFENNISNNSDGIWIVRSSSYNTIYRNNITNNEYGIRQSMPDNFYSNNIIYHNNFINNTDQVYIENPTVNIWDDGYPSGGNYWSDYSGVDVKSGANQDQPSSDGIGDKPYVINANNQDNYPLMYPWGTPTPPSHTLTIYSSPTGVTFAVDGVYYTTPWSGTYSEGASVSLVMPLTHTVGDARYYWNQWSDGNTSRSRTVTMTANITLTAYYNGPYYELTITSTHMTGIPFNINGTPETTPYTEWLVEGSYTLEMPQTHNGYVWSHWQEDGDPNRNKTVTMDTNITLTAVYEPAPPPSVGGKATPIIKPELPISLIWLLTIIIPIVATALYVKFKKKTMNISLFSIFP